MGLLTYVLLPFLTMAHDLSGNAHTPVLADLPTLRALNIPVLAENKDAGVGYAILTPEMEAKMHKLSHSMGRCGSFEALPMNEGFQTWSVFSQLDQLQRLVEKDKAYAAVSFRTTWMVPRADIVDALAEVQANEIRNWVTWLSSFKNRYNKAPDANKHIEPFIQRLRDMTKNSLLPITIDTIDHNSTRQKSIRLRIIGSTRPDEIVVMGGHLDSIASSIFGATEIAPGADDNASGSSSLVEALRVIMTKPQPERTLEFMWYAGEESGLLGSAEIAAEYKRTAKNVVGALQLDMTLFPGSGALVIGNVQDFTSAWLREKLVAWNQTYLKVQLINDKCGYACSDHASWYKNGFATLMPFESNTRNMNKQIHTANDVISSTSNFEHSAVFAKIAVLFAMDLANSTDHQPY